MLVTELIVHVVAGLSIYYRHSTHHLLKLTGAILVGRTEFINANISATVGSS
jgi:hypothetical protein